jgi:hypothetical protein
MIKDYTFHENGKIIANIKCDDSEISFYIPTYGNYIEAFSNINTDYVLDNAIVKKQSQSIFISKNKVFADGIDFVLFSNVNYGIFSAVNTLTGEYVSGEIDSEDSFKTTIPGIYNIKIESIGYFDFETNIEAI